MRKFLLAAATVLVATMSLANTASADSRDNGDDNWRHNGRHSQNDDRDGWDRGRNDGDRHGGWDGRHSDNRDGWRHDRWRHDRGWRGEGWRGPGWRGGYWGGPRVVIEPGYDAEYCFVKKVVRYDDWGNAYIRKVRVCR